MQIRNVEGGYVTPQIRSFYSSYYVIILPIRNVPPVLLCLCRESTDVTANLLVSMLKKSIQRLEVQLHSFFTSARPDRFTPGKAVNVATELDV
jgi:hypothetical protein